MSLLHLTLHALEKEESILRAARQSIHSIDHTSTPLRRDSMSSATGPNADDRRRRPPESVPACVPDEKESRRYSMLSVLGRNTMSAS